MPTPHTASELRVVNGKFEMTFIKSNGDSRFGIWSIAQDQRVTSNPDYVNLIEHLENGSTRYRAIDFSASTVTEFNLIES